MDEDTTHIDGERQSGCPSTGWAGDPGVGQTANWTPGHGPPRTAPPSAVYAYGSNPAHPESELSANPLPTRKISRETEAETV